MGLLDFCKVGIDGSAERGLGDTIETAILAERLGYKRYWLAEHWGADVSTPSPELLTPIIAGMTERIRVGPAGVLLPFYSPLKVASNALLAERLFPGRIDLGLARGGAAPQVVRALAGHVDANLAATYPDKVREVVSYLEGRGPVLGGPNISSVPEVWVLGAGGGAPLWLRNSERASRHHCFTRRRRRSPSFATYRAISLPLGTVRGPASPSPAFARTLRLPPNASLLPIRSLFVPTSLERRSAGAMSSSRYAGASRSSSGRA
jgi:luciferase family oxidoreductase group 1